MWATVPARVVLVLVVAVYLYVKKRYSYFEERGVKSVKPLPFIGSMWRSILFKKHFLDDLNDAYRSFHGEKYFGTFDGLTPAVVIRDPEIIKKITIKDFDHFIDHRNAIVQEDQQALISKSLPFLKGEKWRDMRGALSPAFTGSKMRMMLPLMTEISEQVVQYLERKAKEGENGKLTEPMEIYDLFTRVANDVIASCAFGLNVDSLKEQDNEFYSMGMRLIKISTFTNEATEFFRNVMTETMKHRENNGIIRHDMIQLLMETRNGILRHTAQTSDDGFGFATVHESQQKFVKRQWTDDELAAQAFIFFFAGFDTISTALTFAVHELAINPEVQEKLRAEVDRCHATHTQLTYEVIQGLKYMDMVISENLRKWASIVILDRECAKEYIFEPPRPGGKPFTMKEKSYLHIYANAIHMDENYFPEPEKFDPERFSDERKHTIQPFTYMPFGSGPRNCIGSRFALMEMKVILYQLLLKFELVACEKTTNPMRLAPGLRLAVLNDSWIKLKSRK